MRDRTPPTRGLHFPGTARESLQFYGDDIDCTVELPTFQEFNRTDGPAKAIAHGSLMEGPVVLFGADALGNEQSVRCGGLMLSLLGTATPSVLKGWTAKLSDGGRVVEDLRGRPWGAGVGSDRRPGHRPVRPALLIGFEDGDDD